MTSGQKKLDGGLKFDASKRRMDLIPPSLLNAVSTVLGFGAKKYGDNNWREGLKWSRVYAACQRHLNDFWSGEDIDRESHLSHLYHAACSLAFLIEFYETRKDLDDRWVDSREQQHEIKDPVEKARNIKQRSGLLTQALKAYTEILATKGKDNKSEDEEDEYPI